MATDPNTLLEAAKCYDCYGSPGTWQLFELGLWKTRLLALDAMADTTPNGLLEAAKCYDCNGAPGEWQLFKLGLLQKILLAQSPGTDTSPNALLEAAKCYDCYGGGGLWTLMELGLLAQIAGGGGGSCPQDMQVAWTPTNLKLGENLGFFTFGDIPGITAITFNQATNLSGFDIEAGSNIASISWPNLVSIDPSNTQGGYIDIANLPALTSLSFPLLAQVGGQIIIVSNSALTALSFPSLTTLGGNLVGSGNALTSFSAPVFLPTNGKNVDLNNNALNAASVNGVLARCVANAGYVTGNVFLNNGTNAAPSGQGIADKATLIGRGVTVNTN